MKINILSIIAILAYSNFAFSATTTYQGLTYLVQAQAQPSIVINTNSDILDKSTSQIDWALNKTLAANYTLLSSEAGKSPWIFSGTLSSGVTITTPAKTFNKIVHNNSGQTLTFTTGSGISATVSNGSRAILTSDGTNIYGITFP